MTETALASTPSPGRPCRYCVANLEGYLTTSGRPTDYLRPDAEACELSHRDEQRVYDLAEALAKAIHGHRPRPTDEQISWFLEDADEVVDDFDPAPQRWRARRLPPCVGDGEDGIEVRLRINDVTYVALEGGKECRGSVLRLAEFRRQIREANAEAERWLARQAGDQS